MRIIGAAVLAACLIVAVLADADTAPADGTVGKRDAQTAEAPQAEVSGPDEFDEFQADNDSAGSDAEEDEGSGEEDEEVEPPSTFHQLFSMATWIVGMFGAYLVYLFWTQDSVLYHPEQPSGMRRPMDIPPQARLGSPSMREPPLPFKTIYIKTEDDVRLHAWLIHAQDEATRKVAPTLVYLHGNAGNMAFRLPNVEVLYAACKGTINVLMLEYRGYGESTGTANEVGLGKDVDAALKFLRCGDEVDPKNVFVFGRSLGGAVAVRGAVGSEAGMVRGLVLENTFTSVADMVDRLFPQLKWFKSLVLRIDWPTVTRLAALTETPAMFISGGKDQLIPAEHMQRNYLAHGAPKDLKTFVSVTVGTHNDTWQRGGWRYYKELFVFLKKHSAPEAAKCVFVPQRQWWGAWARRRDMVMFRAAVDAAAPAIEPSPPSPTSADHIQRTDSAAITSVLSQASAARPRPATAALKPVPASALRTADLELDGTRLRASATQAATLD